ncbi:hypothetical protein FHX82_005295 [Amycolatopsis bartoniae]|uniref:Uncharacterized protein n=1 Tax=Amycolatopsis bartoniae TaxID=941986 RepID=A0A8H9IP41_9PSEU|nr:hypothetical protein [Amycolatopsis bartoniae]MBB2938219.1 hypothetical protein [Amycolatopsis bartoniae]TVT09000.1 hypothetical protein FNH07_10175 [Amycolatopsis bartoniae]GHF33551.1 hypothetical protein GCM10017566_02730 [Amycolatopsis bartoniae]
MNAPGRTVDDVRAYLLDQIGRALRRPSAYGGEVSLILLFRVLAFTDCREQQREEELAALQAREASGAAMVIGRVTAALGSRDTNAMASVYTEAAYRQGWLSLDRALPPDEYEHVRQTARPWCAEDRQLSDLLAEFGEPSVRWPTSEGCLGYGTANPADPLVFFHLKGSVLLATRFGDGDFFAGFTYTPAGKALRG